MTVTDQVKLETKTDDPELRALLPLCFTEKPKKEDLAALRKLAEKDPARVSRVYILAEATEAHLIEKVCGPQKAIRILTEANLIDLRRQFGYDQAPIIERLLIDNICLCWMRLQWAEFQLSGEQPNWDAGEYWEKRLSAAQRRYLRAVETLARVRKMALPALQVNIASEGGQQVNIAGDLVRKAG